MKQYAVSTTTGKEYCPTDCARLLNMKQILFYMKLGVEIKDFYPSVDYKTGEPVLVFLVDKRDSQAAYLQWMSNYTKVRNNE